MKRIAPNPSDLAFREYWDNFGYEQESMTLQQKILRLGVFVNEGGHISEVIDQYIIGKEDWFQLKAIQWTIFRYLTYMMNAGKPLLPAEPASLVDRIKCLEKEELIELLEMELKRCVVFDSHTKKEYLIDDFSIFRPNDTNLYVIERLHIKNHPDETLSEYYAKTSCCENHQPGFWTKPEK